MTSFAAILRTELRLAGRDFFTLFFAFVFPPLLLLVFGSIFGGYPGQTGATMLDDMTPAYCCMIMGVTGLLSFPLMLATNIERGVYRRFDASPVGKNQVIWGELAANIIITLAGLALLLLVSWLSFGVFPKGNRLVLAGAVLADAFMLFAIGLCLVAVAPDARTALALCYAVYFIMMFLSGATLPRMLFPEPLRAVSDFLPMTYAVRLLQCAFNGEPIVHELLVVLALGAGCGITGTLFLRRKF